MASRMDALRRYRALKSGFVVLLSKWTVFRTGLYRTGKRFETLQGVCDEKTVCRSAKSVKGQPLKAGRKTLENLCLATYRLRAGRQGAGRGWGRQANEGRGQWRVVGICDKIGGLEM